VQHVAETALGEDANFLLARANALAITEGNSALAEHGLRVRSYSVLVLAAAEAGPSQRELAEILRLDPSQVVALVDELEGRGLVDRRPAPGDRRANVVVATEEGRDLLARATVSAGLAEHRVLEELDASERIQLVALLRRIAFRTV
jgi:DNA-binding MarR family transcriptional regulator